MVIAIHPDPDACFGGTEVVDPDRCGNGALLLTMPSFFEIRLALLLLAAGASAGTALAVLIAAPAVNLALLLVIASYSHWKVAVLVTRAVWATAVAGGLLIG